MVASSSTESTVEREHRRARRLRPHQGVLDRPTLTPLGDGLAVDAVSLGEGGYGLLAALDGAADGVRGAGAAV